MGCILIRAGALMEGNKARDLFLHHVKIQLFANQEERSHLKLNLLASDLELLSLQKSEKINFCYLSCTVCGVLLWQPKLRYPERV